MLELTTHQSALLILLARTRVDRANNNHLHAVADDHVPSLTVAVMYALLKGKKAFKASRDPAAVRQAVHDALLQSLPKVLLKTMVAGGEAGIKKLGTMRVAGDVEGHPFHGNQWTSGSGGESDTEKFYHGTSYTRLESILKNGLDVSHAGETYTQSSKKSVYLAKTEKEARYWATSASMREHVPGSGDIEDHVILEVHIPISEISRISPDKKAGGDDAVKFRGNIKPEWIKSSKIGSSMLGKPPRHLEESVETIKVWVVVILSGDKIRTAKGPLTSPFKMSFDASNSRAVAWARDHAAELATGISDTTEQIIRDAIARAQDEGDLSEQYDEILAAIGDEDRASLIARTESMTAANEGNRQGWDQAVDAGLLTGDEQRVWIATSDACPECEALDEEETSLDGSYPGDGEDGPPLHPNCRCTEGLVL